MRLYRPPEHRIALTPEKVNGIASVGGTILGTTNKGNPFMMPVCNAAGEWEQRDLSDRVLDNFRRLRFDALVAVGGDGSLEIAHQFAEKGMPVIGVPRTIDNDMGGTVITFGFDTAVSTPVPWSWAPRRFPHNLRPPAFTTLRRRRAGHRTG